MTTQPDAPRKERAPLAIEKVRRYVMSSLIAGVLGLHSLAVATLGVTQPDKGGSRVGLFILSSLFGLLGVGAVRLFNKKRLFTPWLLLAFVVPTATYVVALKVIGVS